MEQYQRTRRRSTRARSASKSAHNSRPLGASASITTRVSHRPVPPLDAPPPLPSFLLILPVEWCLHTPASHIPLPIRPRTGTSRRWVARLIARTPAHPPLHARPGPLLRLVHKPALHGIAVDVADVPCELVIISHVAVEAAAPRPEPDATGQRDPSQDGGIELFPPAYDPLRDGLLDELEPIASGTPSCGRARMWMCSGMTTHAKSSNPNRVRR